MCNKAHYKLGVRALVAVSVIQVYVTDFTNENMLCSNLLCFCVDVGKHYTDVSERLPVDTLGYVMCNWYVLES